MMKLCLLCSIVSINSYITQNLPIDAILRFSWVYRYSFSEALISDYAHFTFIRMMVWMYSFCSLYIASILAAWASLRDYISSFRSEISR
jgi:hypothetical protein